MTSNSDVDRAVTQQPRDERMILAPEERREAILQVMCSARERLLLSLFRCTDFKLLDALAEARKRGVRVEVLLTRRAKGWKKRLKKLRAFLEGMGAQVYRYSGKVSRYHAKYMVADDGPAMIASLNFTRKCFRNTCDFLLLTHDPGVVSGLKRLFEADACASVCSFPDGMSNRLIVGPEQARQKITALLLEARSSIQIIDHRVVDPGMVALLNARRAEGVAVEVLGRGALGGLLSHGKMILVDRQTALIGSISLSRPSLDSRREVAVLLRDPGCVGRLNEFFRGLVAARGPDAAAFPSPQDATA